MEFCSHCGANIEGLIDHCDCCGAPIVLRDELVNWNTFMTQASGDLAFWANHLFREAVSAVKPPHLKDIQRIKFELFCYPEEIISSEKIKTSVYFSSIKKLVRVRIVMDFDAYTSKTSLERKRMVVDSIIQGIHIIQNRIPKSEVLVQQFLCDLEGQIIHTTSK